MGDNLTKVFDWFFSASKIGFRDVINGKLRVVTIGDQPAEIIIENDPDALLPAAERKKGSLYIKRTGWLEVYGSSNMETGDMFFPPDQTANSNETFEKQISWNDYETMFLGNPSVYMRNSKGGFGTLTISFKYEDQSEVAFEEMVEVATIRVDEVFPLDDALNEISAHDLLNSQNGLRYNVSFYQGPTIQEFRDNVHMALSAYRGKDLIYPNELISPVDIYKDNEPQNGADVVIRTSGGKNWLELKTFPIVNFLPSTPTTLLEEPLYTYDIYPKESVQSQKDSEALGMNKPGMQYGKSRHGGKYRDYLFADECISPVTDRNGHFSYIRYAGVVYPTLYLGNEVVHLDGNRGILPFRNTCSWQAGWFMQSGHGLGTRCAGLQVPGGRLDLLSPDENGQLYKDVLISDWKKVKVAILNSCYNLNLHVQTGVYPDPEDIWVDSEDDDVPNGKWNNGLKWLEVIEKRGVVLGWGQCNVDGVRYGARSSGQSPSDIQYRVEWTALMMEYFIIECNENSKISAIEIAEKWVQAAEKAIKYMRDNGLKINQNMYNAIGVGVVNNEIHAWALDANRTPAARRLWLCPIN